jgi:alpha-tubulin suppressor-like RCC1 family protein
VVAWGENDEKQCDVPIGLTDVVGISAGFFNSLAVKKDGSVVAWGRNEQKQCDVPIGLTNVVGISGGSGHTLVIKKKSSN